MKLNFRIFVPIISTSKILAPSISKMISCPGFSLFGSSCHGNFLLAKTDIPATELNMLKHLRPDTSGLLLPMVSCGFIPMVSLPLIPIHPLRTSGLLYRLPRNIPVTLSPSVNGSGCLVGVDDGWLIRHVVQMQYTTVDGM